MSNQTNTPDDDSDGPMLLGRRVGLSITEWYRNFKQSGEGCCVSRSQGVTFHFRKYRAKGVEAGPAPGGELRFKRATIVIEVSDPAEFAELFKHLDLSPEEICITIHPTTFSKLPPQDKPIKQEI